MKDLRQLGSAPLDARVLALQDKENVKGENEGTEVLDQSECGLDNPCKWGKHNPNFNPKNISGKTNN